MSTHLDATFDTPEPIDLSVENGRGLVDVRATDTVETTVRITGERAEEFEVRDLGDRIAIIAPPRSHGLFGKDPRAEIVVEVPLASRLDAKVGSSDVTTRGQLGDTRVESGSGDITLDVVDGATVVRSGSGDLQATHLAGEARIKTGSGDIVLRRADSAVVVTTGSGDVRLEDTRGDVAVKTGSGDAQLGSVSGDTVFTSGSGDLAIEDAVSGRVSVKTSSGDVRIGVRAGTPVWTDVRTSSGRLSSTLPATGEPGPDQPYVEVRATTASGDLTLHPSS